MQFLNEWGPMILMWVSGFFFGTGFGCWLYKQTVVQGLQRQQETPHD